MTSDIPASSDLSGPSGWAPSDTENKSAWCSKAEIDERAFAVQRLFDLGLAGCVNPAKRDDPYTHDLLVNFPSELKSVRTPLFKAEEMFGLNPQYTVSINTKDMDRYKRLYPDLVIVFDVLWETTEKVIDGKTYRVEPMHHTYAGFIHDIRNAVQAGGNKKLTYARRVDDTSGNAKASYVFDIRWLHKLGEPS